MGDRVREAGEDVSTWGVCFACRVEFTEEDWWERHTALNGEDVHPGCCDREDCHEPV